MPSSPPRCSSVSSSSPSVSAGPRSDRSARNSSSSKSLPNRRCSHAAARSSRSSSSRCSPATLRSSPSSSNGLATSSLPGSGPCSGASGSAACPISTGSAAMCGRSAAPPAGNHPPMAGSSHCRSDSSARRPADQPLQRPAVRGLRIRGDGDEAREDVSRWHHQRRRRRRVCAGGVDRRLAARRRAPARIPGPRPVRADALGAGGPEGGGAIRRRDHVRVCPGPARAEAALRVRRGAVGRRWGGAQGFPVAGGDHSLRQASAPGARGQGRAGGVRARTLRRTEACTGLRAPCSIGCGRARSPTCAARS